MSNIIKIKNSGTASNSPSAGSLEYGELALNYTDGKLYFKNSNSTVNFFSTTGSGASAFDDLSDVVITSPEEFQGISYNGTSWVNSYIPLVSYVQNAEANTITTGTCVYLFGATGDHASVKRADNSSDTTSSKTIGVVGANIAASNNGPIITRGYVDGIDLSTGYTAGDVLWLGTNGAFTKTKPTAPAHLVFIGVVVRATNNGIIYVATQNGYELDELHNVSAGSPSAGDFLKYNGSLWVSEPIDLGTDTTGSYVASLVAGTGITLANNSGEGATPTITNSGVTSINTTLTGDVTGIVTTSDTGTVTSAMIADGTIVNADVSTSAAIAHSKLANATAGQVLLGTTTTGVVTATTVSGDVTINGAGVTAIGSGVIVNADVNASAAIAHSKLANATAGQVLLGTTTTGVVTATTLSGDVTINGAGVTAISSGVIVDADVNSSAAIAVSKLASGTSGQVLMANATGVPTYTSLSGDVTISSSGVTTIAANSVALGTDTTGDYVSTITAGTGVTTTGAATGENISHTISIGQSVATNANPTFAGATLDVIQVGITTSGEIDTSSGNLTLDSAGGTVAVDDNLTVSGNLTLTGNLIVNGTTTTVNSTTVTLDDPIITLGGDTTPSVDDNKDRGVEFKWHNGTAAKVGFFGYDDSSGKFTFIPDATNTSEVFSGTKGTVDANIEWTDVLSKPDPVVTVTLTGDVTGTASATLTDLASNTVTVSTTIAANSVALGTDTTGNYMSGISGTSPVSVSHTPGEGSSATVSLATAYGDTINPYGSKTANYVLASPDGTSGVPSFRAIVAADIPTLNQNTTGSAANWTTARTITLGGDLTGSVSIDGSANATLTATIAANSVELGTDTTGNYVSGVSAGTGISVSHTPSEGSTATVSVDTAYAGFAPIGSVIMWSGSTAPTGWAICSGTELAIASYGALYAIIGTRYGALTNGAGAAGTTHFRLPSFSTKIPKGLISGTPASSGTPAVAGTTVTTSASSAVDSHTHGINSSFTAGTPNSSFTAGNISNHTHSLTGNVGTEDTLHYHYWSAAGVATGGQSVNHSHGYFKPNSGNNTNTGNVNADHTHSWTLYNQGTGVNRNSSNNVDLYHFHSISTGNVSMGNPSSTSYNATFSAGNVNSSFTAGNVNSSFTAGNASTINSSTASHTHTSDALDIVFIIRVS